MPSPVFTVISTSSNARQVRTGVVALRVVWYSGTTVIQWMQASESKQIENTINLVSGNLRRIVALEWGRKIGKPVQCPVEVVFYPLQYLA